MAEKERLTETEILILKKWYGVHDEEELSQFENFSSKERIFLYKLLEKAHKKGRFFERRNPVKPKKKSLFQFLSKN